METLYLTAGNPAYCAKVSDLTPLEGMRLLELSAPHVCVLTQASFEVIFDLARKGCSFVYPKIDQEAVGLYRARDLHDLRPLKGLQTKVLDLREFGVTDLSPLRDIGLGLERPLLTGTRITDLTPLRGLKLNELHPPARDQLTPESTQLVEELKKTCKVVGW